MKNSLIELEKKYSSKAAGPLSQMLRKSRSNMAPALRKHVPLILEYFNLINIAAPATMNDDNTSDSKYVCANLLARIANDLLALTVLAPLGLSMQTAAISASTYECAVTIGAIGGSNNEAEKWLNHSDSKKSIESISELTRRTKTNLNLSLDLYEFYSWLCAPKHSNPVTQRRAGRDLCPNHSQCNAQYFFPTGSINDQIIAGISIELALIMTGIALMSFLNNHMSDEKREEFANSWEQLDSKLDALLAKRLTLSF